MAALARVLADLARDATFAARRRNGAVRGIETIATPIAPTCGAWVRQPWRCRRAYARAWRLAGWGRAGGVYLKHGDAYVAMTERPYEGEAFLQALIAQHPEVLTDEGAGQGPLLFVRREAALRDREDGSGRWSLDHLYVDREGVPTLVEVKRSSDTRGRREVVAQMLDYAANARHSFSADT